ncbi:hypothetical protein [Oceanobacillus caeni]|uniref:hypothetical protein n=1 Tax=Oceanobacillus caeni TaxID=405946 RepID=UPI00363817FE
MNTTLDGYKKSYVIEQLRKYNYQDTDDKTYKELVNQLARLRAMEVKAESPNVSWF